MNATWREISADGGIRGAMDTLDYDEALVEVRSDYRWTPACQRVFLEELAASGSVMAAVRHVAKSARSAYALRFRRDGAAFRLAWDAAVLIARATLADLLMDRVIHGHEEVTARHPDGTVIRGKFDNRLGQGLLNRLDRIAEAQAAAGSVAAQVQLVVQDFEAFLELLERGGTGAEAALFCAARSPLPPAGDPAIDRELAQILAADEPEEGPADEAEPSPEEAAAELSVWWDEIDRRFVTDFPPRSAEEAAMVEETGRFGDPDYSRTLTPEEDAIEHQALETRLADQRAAALAAHAEWFGFKAAA